MQDTIDLNEWAGMLALSGAVTCFERKVIHDQSLRAQDFGIELRLGTSGAAVGWY